METGLPHEVIPSLQPSQVVAAFYSIAFLQLDVKMQADILLSLTAAFG